MGSAVSRKISIQVSLSGFSFSLSGPEGEKRSPWLGPERVFSTPELQEQADEVAVSLFTPKCTMVPEKFFDEDSARQLLSGVCGSALKDTDVVEYVSIPQFGAVMVYSNTIGESLSEAVVRTLKSTAPVRVLPELFYVVSSLSLCKEYNKIVASYRDGFLFLAVAQGGNLLLANVFHALDFVTAEYFIFLSLKKLQMNPEVSVISLRTPISMDEEMSLYRYFKAVEVL